MKLHDLIDHLIAIELDGGGDRPIGFDDSRWGFVEITTIHEEEAVVAHNNLKEGQEFIELC